jgi:tetratricopeptide (TPR) repeat protein
MVPQLFLSLLLLVAPQGGVGIQGRVLLPTTQSQGRMEIILEKSGAFLARTFSDNEGHFRFINLPDGQYVVVIRLEGYEDVREPASFSRDGLSTMNLTMTRKSAIADDLQTLGDNFPRKVIDDYEKALEESRKGNTARATEILEGIVKVATDFQQAHNALGTLYQKAEKFQNAEKEYNAALQLDPHSSEPLVNLGSLYIQIAEQAQSKHDNQTFSAALDGAVRALTEAIRVQPDSAKAYYFLGTTYFTGGKFARAEEYLTQALQLEKGMGNAELVLANVFIRQQKWKQAVEYLDAYLRDNPKAADRDQIEQTRARIAARN